MVAHLVSIWKWLLIVFVMKMCQSKFQQKIVCYITQKVFQFKDQKWVENCHEKLNYDLMKNYEKKERKKTPCYQV